MSSTATATAERLQRELDDVMRMRNAAVKRLILEERRLDVLAVLLGYKVYPFHAMLIEAYRAIPGPWRLVLAPRGCGKSTILTVVDCVLRPLLDPDVRICLVSSVVVQSKDMLEEVEGCFENERFVDVFGDLRGDNWAREQATVRTRRKRWKEPTFLVSGQDGPVTSKHFDVLKCDDLVTEKNSRSQTEREKTTTFLYKTAVPTLLRVRADGSAGELDVIGTLYDPEDTYHRLMEDDPAFEGNVVQVPALVNPFTGAPDVANGVSVVPEILPSDDLRALRVSMGSAHFDSQFQQSTARMKGAIFKDEMFLHFDDDPEDLVRRLELKVWAACDLAIGEREESDEYADVVVGVDDRTSDLVAYVLEVFHGRIPYTVQIARASYIFERWSPIRFGIEANAFQKSRLGSVYRELGSEIGDRCVPVVTLTDKVTRAWKLSARYEAGRVLHRKADLATDALEEQLTGFPRKKHDDMFDALDLAVALGCVLRARRKRSRKVGIFGMRGGKPAGRVRLSLSR